MKIRNVLLNGDNTDKKREEIKAYFLQVYETYEKLFKMLKSDEVFYKKANPLRHPLIFYYGHTATFFINKLILAKIIKRRINPTFESIFAIGVDEMSWDDLDENNYDWPRVDEVRRYRDEVKALMIDLIETLPLKLPIDRESPFWAILMGIEHENIHIETSSVLMRELPIDDVIPLSEFDICKDSSAAPKNELLEVPGAKVVMGKSFDTLDYYGWDNEYGHKEEIVKEFKASKYLVSNGEFLEFVKEGGYEKKEYWSDEGQKWLEFKKSKYPAFWVKEGEHYRYRTIAKVIDMPWNWPVDVNYLEAEAFCNYLSEKTSKPVRLPSEEEYYRLYEHAKVPDISKWGEKAPANINLEYFASSSPVDMFEFNGFYDIIGNVWQWTCTPINGYNGFKVHPLYDDFSTPTFDGKHNLFKGGSFISCGNEMLKSARYAFRRHFFQHAGFRYIESNAKVVSDVQTYEDDLELTKYIELCYGKEQFGVKNYHKEFSDYILQITKNLKKEKALELGTLAGRVGFELSKEYDKVHALDFTARLIQFAVNFKKNGKLRYILKDEGELVKFKEIDLSSFNFAECKHKVEFWQGDMANLKPNFSGYDLVVLNDVITRSYNPKKFLQEVDKRMNEEALLVISSSYDWNEEITPKEFWIGGVKKNGENYHSREALKDLMESRFEVVEEGKVIPCAVQNDSKNFIYKNIEVIVWQKK